MMLMPRIEGNTSRENLEFSTSSTNDNTNNHTTVENVNFLDFVRNATANDNRNNNSTFVHQTESRTDVANNKVSTFDDSNVLTKRQGREHESESTQTNRENSSANNDVRQHKVIKPFREDIRSSDGGVGNFQIRDIISHNDGREVRETRIRQASQRESDYFIKANALNTDKMLYRETEPIVHAAILAMEIARELPVHFQELKLALRSFPEENGLHNVAKRNQIVQDLLLKAQQTLITLNLVDGNESRGEANSSIQLKQKLHALIESLDRVRKQSGDISVEIRDHRIEQKNTAEVTVRNFSNGSEFRNDATRYAESAMRVDGMPNNSLRSNYASQAAPAAKQFPFLPEQFETFLQQARIVVRDAQNGSFSMNLYPESLGRVNVNLGLEEGILVGRFLVESQHAREAIQESLERLIAQLAEAGIEVGSFQVNVRGERDRLVHELQGYLSERNEQFSSNRGGQYEVQSMRIHDGILDVIA